MSTPTTMSWPDASTLADSMGPDVQLVTIRDAAENQWVYDNFSSINGGEQYWIGYTDQIVEGTWVWTSGESSSYTNWSPGEPNNGNGVGQDFASTGGSYNEKWDDAGEAGGEDFKAILEHIGPMTFYVDGAGNGDYLDIQSAINDSMNGDTVIVRDGSYDESITLDSSKHITLKSENGPANCSIIDSAGNIVVNFIDAGTTSVIDGFTIGWTSNSGIDVSHGGSPTILNCIIEECDNNGIDINGSPTIENCIIRNCDATYGGGIEIHSGWSAAIITNCTIENCGAVYGAGVYLTTGSKAILTNCSINDCTAAYDGGGLYTDTDSANSNLALTNCTFLNNYAGRQGGGMGFTGSAPTLNNCTFTNNSCANNGGGMWFNNGSIPTLIDCTFTNNTAGDDGGAIAAHNEGTASTLNLNSCTIENNTAVNGGGVDFAGSFGAIEDCLFTDNYATHVGGGIKPHSYSDVVINNSQFLRNRCDNAGGAIDAWGDSSVSINNSLFEGNYTTSTVNEFAHVLRVGARSNATLDNITVAENGSGNYLIYIYSGSGASTGTMRNSIYWPSASAWPLDTSVECEYSCIRDGGNQIVGNINTDPLFVDAFNGDYRLQHVATGHTNDSPCIDTGDPNTTPFGSTRIDGFPDLGIIDMGFRPIDAPIDSDLDGLGDDAEINLGTDHLDQDTDDDGLSDGEEVFTFSTDPTNLDTDSDGLQDGTELGNVSWWTGDSGNGIEGTDTSIYIPDADPNTTTDPLDDDTDNDGLMDGQEDVNQDGEFMGIELDPNNFDGDNDGLSDGLELGLDVPNGNDTDMTVFVADADPSTTTRATLRDTDGGGIHDGIEDANRNGMIDAGEIDPRDASDDSVYLKHNGASVGGHTTLNFYACEPGSLMVLCYSLTGSGPTAFANVTLDLSQPIGQLPVIYIDSNGSGQVGPLPVPASVSVGDQAWFQGVQVSIFGTSTVLTTTNMTPLTIQ